MADNFNTNNGLPILGDYYEIKCPNVEEIVAINASVPPDSPVAVRTPQSRIYCYFDYPSRKYPAQIIIHRPVHYSKPIIAWIAGRIGGTGLPIIFSTHNMRSRAKALSSF